MDSLVVLIGAMLAASGVTACALLAVIVLRGAWMADRKAAIGLYCLLTSAALLWRGPLGRYLDHAAPASSKALLILSGGVPGAIWLLVVALFEDRRLRRADLMPLLLSSALLAPAVLPIPGRGWVFRAWVGLSVLITGHALTILIRTWPGDMVEARRRARTQLAGLMGSGCALFAAMLLQMSLGRALGSPSWTPMVLSALLVLAIMAAATLILDTRGDLFEAPRRRPAENDDADLLHRLHALMGHEKPWRQESFCLADLAGQLGAPEYRVRRLIHLQLGYRNFAEFVNGYRLAAAQHLLAGQDRTTIAQAAFAVGFGSLSPFNRAFKQQTGLTPTAWRKQKLGENSN